MDKTGNILSLLEFGARAEGMRQKAIASNIANINTPGYRRQDVRFEELLADALSSNKQLDTTDINQMVYRPKNSPVKENGNDVSFENEVGEMVKNSIRHKAFIRIINKKYRQFAQAIDTRG